MIDTRASCIRLTLPEPPSSNRYWRVFRGRAVKSRHAREYIETVAAAFDAQATNAEREALPLTGPVAVTLAWHRGARRGDLDNRLKVVCDSLAGLLYVNDRQIIELHASRHESPRAGRLVVEVRAA